VLNTAACIAAAADVDNYRSCRHSAGAAIVAAAIAPAAVATCEASASTARGFEADAPRPRLDGHGRALG
tara:strand:+ start:273 stop:479 length:207 start_codon:yes stop_codon:yes gene_type:complete